MNSSFCIPIRASNVPTPVPKREFPLQDFLNDTLATEINEVGVYQLPGPKSSEGDDTYLISGDGKTIGVFDGIGGNWEYGINPRDYSYSLMTGCRIGVNDKQITDPLQVLKEGFNFASKVSGSSAAIVGHLDDTEDIMYLDVINVGDSQFMVLRKNENSNVFSSVMKSEPQYDASVVSWSNLPCPMQLTGNEERSDKPDVGVRYHVPIFDGDIIIMASDGLYDNLFDSEIIGILNECHKQTAQEIAKMLTLAAFVNSKNKTKHSPFSKTIGKLIGYEIGGKEDDITTVVMKISLRPMI